MKRARYDTRAIGHFALQLKNYSHFTSPIRRFADFRIHTLIDNVETLDYNHDNMVELEKELIEVATNTSTMEKTAQEIENEALLMAMAEYMEGHIGETYTGIVTEIYSHGMFVKADNLVSGKVSFNDMGSGKFKFDYDKKTVINCDTHQKYQIGNKVYVAVKDASKIQRTVNFEIIDKPKQKLLKRTK